MIALALAAFGQESPSANGQLFRPSIDSEKTLWADDSGRARPGYVLARGLVHYANRPVVYVGEDGAVAPVVGDVLQLSVLAAYSRGPLRLGVDLPVYAYANGLEGGETGLGDLGVDLKASLLDREKSPIGLAISGRVTLPTTTVSAALGSRGLGYELTAIADRAFGDLLVAANVGTRGIPGDELENFRWDDQLVARLGLGYGDLDGAGVSLDVGSHLPYANVVPGSTPVEAIAGGWVRPAGNLVVRAGLGTGLTTGFGAPRMRALVGFAWEPSRARDRDADGVVDGQDACPDDPEDLDGYEDDDGCPEPTRVRVRLRGSDGEPVDGRWALSGTAELAGSGAEGEVDAPSGSYTLVAAADRHVQRTLSVDVPGGERHEILVELEREVLPATLTVTLRDADGNAVPGASWGLRGKGNPGGLENGGSVEVEAGEYTVRGEAPGYRPVNLQAVLVEGQATALDVRLAPAKVEVTRDRIDIKESVFFETGKAIIKPESYGLLDEVAQTIVEHPELTRIRIEGHTDSRGSAASNLTLSRDRANAVRAYLVQRGVAESRLESEGFGEGRPLDPRNDETAWAKNRRVDFFVAARADGPAP